MRYLAIIIILAGVVGTALAQVDTSAVIQTAQQNYIAADMAVKILTASVQLTGGTDSLILRPAAPSGVEYGMFARTIKLPLTAAQKTYLNGILNSYKQERKAWADTLRKYLPENK